ncbi:MAG: TIGR02147 family protein, partial [Proteobacteria bacterium]
EDNRHLIDEAAYQVIAEWEHYAVLTLFDCEKFEPSVESIQERLNIKKTRAEVVVDNLLKYGLLKIDQSGRLNKAHSSVKTSEDTFSQALRESHRETLELGKQKIDEIAIELRDFSSLMVAVDKEKIPAAKEAIREFRRKMLSLFEDGEKTEVFQLAIQFYPVSSLKPQESP